MLNARAVAMMLLMGAAVRAEAQTGDIFSTKSRVPFFSGKESSLPFFSGWGKKYGLAGAARFDLPSDSAWKDGFGAEIEARDWLDEKYGLALTLGISEWSPQKDANLLGDAVKAMQASLSGSARLYAMGISGLYRRPLHDKLWLVLKGGLRYTMVDSSAQIDFSFIAHHGGPVVVQSPVSFDDRLGLFLGADVSREIMIGGKKMATFLGLGYQVDLTQGSANWMYEDVGNSFNAFVIRAGISY